MPYISVYLIDEDNLVHDRSKAVEGYTICKKKIVEATRMGNGGTYFTVRDMCPVCFKEYYKEKE